MFFIVFHYKPKSLYFEEVNHWLMPIVQYMTHQCLGLFMCCVCFQLISETSLLSFISFNIQFIIKSQHNQENPTLELLLKSIISLRECKRDRIQQVPQKHKNYTIIYFFGDEYGYLLTQKIEITLLPQNIACRSPNKRLWIVIYTYIQDGF